MIYTRCAECGRTQRVAGVEGDRNEGISDAICARCLIYKHILGKEPGTFSRDLKILSEDMLDIHDAIKREKDNKIAWVDGPYTKEQIDEVNDKLLQKLRGDVRHEMEQEHGEREIGLKK